MEFTDIEELSRADGCELGTTPWREITAQDVQAFADLTGDHQWIHLDQPRASKESPFGGTIVHGAFILALVPVLVGELFRVSGVSHVVNAGMERARLRAPVPVGSRIRGRATLQSVEPFAAGLLARVGLIVEVEGQSRPTCTVEQRMVFHA